MLVCPAWQFTTWGCLGLGKLAGPCGVHHGLQLAAPDLRQQGLCPGASLTCR